MYNAKSKKGDDEMDVEEPMDIWNLSIKDAPWFGARLSAESWNLPYFLAKAASSAGIMNPEDECLLLLRAVHLANARFTRRSGPITDCSAAYVASKTKATVTIAREVHQALVSDSGKFPLMNPLLVNGLYNFCCLVAIDLKHHEAMRIISSTHLSSTGLSSLTGALRAFSEIEGEAVLGPRRPWDVAKSLKRLEALLQGVSFSDMGKKGADASEKLEVIETMARSASEESPFLDSEQTEEDAKALCVKTMEGEMIVEIQDLSTMLLHRGFIRQTNQEEWLELNDQDTAAAHVAVRLLLLLCSCSDDLKAAFSSGSLRDVAYTW